MVCRRCVTSFHTNNIQHDWKVWNLRRIRNRLFIHARSLPNHAQVFFCVISCLLMHNVPKGKGFTAATLAVLAIALYAMAQCLFVRLLQVDVLSTRLDSIHHQAILYYTLQVPGSGTLCRILLGTRRISTDCFTRALKAYLFPRYYTVTCLKNRTRLLCLRTLPKIVNIQAYQ